MKHKLFASLAAVLVFASVSAAAVYADDSGKPKDIPIGASNEVEMVGTVEPTIMSVTMPSSVYFHISRSKEGDNKVISPRITVTNNSSVPVELVVSNTAVDLSKLNGTTWSNGQYVGENQVAIGFKKESIANQMPTTLDQAKWLVRYAYSDIDIMTLNAYGNDSMYVVGALGNQVPENNSFSVTPTFVVKRAN